uniref:Cytochrome P450 6l1 n=1 Tax=Anthurium amnicola TaxID=1678845 RepID=A0A1D1ZHS7_9ARAE
MAISASLLGLPASAASTSVAPAAASAARVGNSISGLPSLGRRLASAPSPRVPFRKLGRSPPTRRNAGLTEIEPDLVEEQRDQWGTNGVSPEDFVYGEYDGHHTYFEGEKKGTFWESVVEEYKAAEPPSGFQGLMSWLFLPAMAAGLAYHVPGEYLYIGAAVFVVIFCGIEMGKPDEPHNFEPQIYNMERESRDKLIADYNTMDIWDFNEKYGDLWDFTVKRDRL